MDEKLFKITDKIKNFGAIYLVDNQDVTDFNTMYELYDPCTVMFFWRYVYSITFFIFCLAKSNSTTSMSLCVVFELERRGPGCVYVCMCEWD